MNLRFDLNWPDDPELVRLFGSPNPICAMLWLGINYDYAIPRPDISQWWFIRCRNVPRKLPAKLSALSGLLRSISDEELRSAEQSGCGIYIPEMPNYGETGQKFCINPLELGSWKKRIDSNYGIVISEKPIDGEA